MLPKKWTNWIEIPASDFDRAIKFYESIFDIQLIKMDLGDLKMAFFPEAEVGVALCFSPWYKPSKDGVLVYLDANPDLQIVLDKIENAGGKIIQTKKQISPDHGYMCLFEDCEGNRLALHSLN